MRSLVHEYKVKGYKWRGKELALELKSVRTLSEFDNASSPFTRTDE